MTFQNTLRSTAIFAVSLVVGTIIPLSVTHALFSYEQTTIKGADGREVQLHRSYTTRQRQDHKRALEIYDQYRQQGLTNLVKPDINDRATVEIYLRNPTGPDRNKEDDRVDPVSTTDYVKPVESVSSRELSDLERKALQRAVKLGACYNYPKFSEAFHTLCKQMVLQTPHEIRPVGFESDLMYTRARGFSGNRSSAVRAAQYQNLPDNRGGGRIVPRGKSGGRHRTGSGYKTRVFQYYKAY